MNIDAPAGELGREADVLPLLADGQGQLLVRDDQLHGVVLGVDQHPGDLRRGDGVADEAGGVFIVRNDVDLLAAQLLDHRLDA